MTGRPPQASLVADVVKGAAAGLAATSIMGLGHDAPLRTRAELGHGLLFGGAFWAVVDQGAKVALGLTPGPARFPWQTHARGLAGHLVFGVAAETTLGLMDAVA